MKIKFVNRNFNGNAAINDFLKMHKMEICDDAELYITVKITGRKSTSIHISGDNAVIETGAEYCIFRALVIIKQMLEESTNNSDCELRNNSEINYVEDIVFETTGAMFDGSQASSLMNIPSCKRMLLYLASMGYNMMMLYCEDCYEIEDEPYFGNMRPRYTARDFKEIDDYASSLGIELVPCIQTLGHLTEVIKRPPYNAISDRPDILLVGDEDVYTLIDKMIETISKCFKSKRIHLGLDEAWDLGLGNYLKKNGYHTQTEIMTKHLERVCEIADKYGMRPMMWGDMFFRAKSKTNDYFDDSVSFDESDRSLVPDGMSVVYWDYYHFDKDIYARNLEKCKTICDNVIFAGCARNVRTFAAHLKKSIETTDAAMSACKDIGIREVLATVWGDDHRESSNFAVLPSLMYFAEHTHNVGNPDSETVKARFRACVGANWECFEDISAFDTIPDYNDSETNNLAVSRVSVWQDIMLGICDANMKGSDMSKHFGLLAEKMRVYAEDCPTFELMFKFYEKLAEVLELKQYMGIKLTDMYLRNDISGLRHALESELPMLEERFKDLRLAHREHFFDEYKPIGWEILDIRYGGAIMRVDTAISRITDYLSGSIDKIEEFEELRLSFTGHDGDLVPDVQTYQMLCSASRL